MASTPYNRYESAIIPIPILKSDLSKSAKLLYGVLVSFAGTNGKCFPSQQKLAEYLSTTERNIRRLIDELIKDNYIGVKRTRFRTYYFFKIPKSWDEYMLPWLDSFVQAPDKTVRPLDKTVHLTGQNCPNDRTKLSTATYLESSEKESSEGESSQAECGPNFLNPLLKILERMPSDDSTRD